MKVTNAIRGFERAGFRVDEVRPGQYEANKDGYNRVRFYRNGKDNEDIVDAYYIAPEDTPPYPHSLKQAIRWAERPKSFAECGQES